MKETMARGVGKDEVSLGHRWGDRRKGDLPLDEEQGSEEPYQ